MRRFALLIGIFVLFAGQISFAREVGNQIGSQTVTQVATKDRTRLHVIVNEGRVGKATFVLLNGLVFESTRWNTMAEELSAKGHTVIRVAYRLQPEALRLLRRGEEPKAFATGIEASGLAEDLHDALVALKVQNKIQLVGLSYGAAVAAEFAARYPKTIDNTILIAPLVIPLDYYDPSGQYLRGWLSTVRFWENASCDMYGMWNPWLCASRDYWYNTFYNALYGRFLHTRVQDIPRDIHPAVYKKSVFHLVRAVRDFNLNQYTAKIPNLHLMVGSRDERALLEHQVGAWTNAPKANKRSLVTFVGAQHALPVEAPVRTAEWLDLIALQKPELQGGRSFKVHSDR